MSDVVPSSPQSPPASLTSPHLEATTSTTPLQSAFDRTTRNLLRLGSMPLDKFAQDPSEEVEGFDIPLSDAANPKAVGYGETATRNSGSDEQPSEEIPNVTPSEAARYLRDVSLQEFGKTSTDPLKYEFLEDFARNRGSCILTITRPNGVSRSYRTKAEFSRKSEAKIEAASSAIKLGAVYFLKNGDPSKAVGRRSMVLAKLDAGMKKGEKDAKGGSKDTKPDMHPEDELDDVVSQIETCCIEWRAGSVTPKWVHLTDPKVPNVHGYALKISLSSNIQRAYSVLASEDYPRRSIAKAACARAALEQNVLEFIKHGDGLEHPIVVPFVGAEALPPPPPHTVTTLQDFHAALPKPLPDHIGMKANGEINAVGWLNTTIQTAKGSRMTATFTWYTDAKLGLHGCLLRLSRPDKAPSQSYLVDAIFPKRADAKIAVCLLACSQGVGTYVREIAAEVDSRVTVEMRRRSTEQILPALGQALNRFKHGSRPEFTYDCDLATFGCTLTIDLSPDPETPIKRQWQVPLAYKSKTDAKFAVACVAADDGVIDFIRNRGKSPSEQVKDAEGEKQTDVELEEGETTETVKKKKKKKGKKDATVDGNTGVVDEGEDAEAELLKKVRNSRKTEPIFETREEALAKGRFGPGPKKRDFTGGRGRWYRSGFSNRHVRGTHGFGPPRIAGTTSRAPPLGLRHPIHSSGVSFSHPSGYASFAFGHGSGYAEDAYAPEYDDDRDYFFHDAGPASMRHMHGPGAAGVDTETSFTHAPSPVRPRVAPGYGPYGDRAGDYDYAPEHGYRHTPYASHSFSHALPPYGYEYPPAAVRVPAAPSPHAYRQTGGAEYSYAHDEYADRQLHSAPRTYEAERYASDYDRIPDRSVTVEPEFSQQPRSHAWPSQSYSHSRISMAPRHLRGPASNNNRHGYAEPQRETASYNRAYTQTVSGATQERDVIYERAVDRERPYHDGMSYRKTTPTRVEPASDTHAKLENLNGVGPSFEQRGCKDVSEWSLTEPQRIEPDGEKHPDSLYSRNVSRGIDGVTSLNEEASVVPSKRGRTSVQEDHDPPSKRQRRRSMSTSWSSELGNPVDNRERKFSSECSKGVFLEDAEAEGEMSTSPSTPTAEHCETGAKGTRDMSLAMKKRKGSEQKEGSYLTELFDHCDKEGISRPEIFHEEIPSDSDKDETTFKVWIVMGSERLELSTSFNTLVAGQERVAKSVLSRLRMQRNKR